VAAIADAAQAAISTSIAPRMCSSVPAFAESLNTQADNPGVTASNHVRALNVANTRTRLLQYLGVPGAGGNMRPGSGR